MHRMAGEFFASLAGPPVANPMDYDRGNDFDAFIRGWTKYWNEIFQPTDRLDPNLVKALIASESDFKPNAGRKSRKKNAAKGLMQLTDQTRQILADEKGELKDFLLNLTEEETYDPNLSIAAGIRWLFHKRELISKRLRRPVTWEEAVAEYKDLHRRFKIPKERERARKLFKRFTNLYERLKGGGR